jgi:hypothetical protein
MIRCNLIVDNQGLIYAAGRTGVECWVDFVKYMNDCGEGEMVNDIDYESMSKSDLRNISAGGFYAPGYYEVVADVEAETIAHIDANSSWDIVE